MTSASPERVRAFARQHDLTRDQARQLLEDHGDDEQGLSEATRNLIHFLRAPS